jgi:ABC-type branched-subunit amino acid transport system ATPase component
MAVACLSRRTGECNGERWRKARPPIAVELVEQNLNFALGLADEVTVLVRGKVVWRGGA